MKNIFAMSAIALLFSFLSNQAYADCVVIKKIESSIATQRVLADLDPNYIRPRMHKQSTYKITASFQLENGSVQTLSQEDLHWGIPDKDYYNMSVNSLGIKVSRQNADCNNEDAKQALFEVLNEVKSSGFEASKKTESKNVLVYHEGVNIPLNPELYFQGDGVPVQYNPEILLVH